MKIKTLVLSAALVLTPAFASAGQPMNMDQMHAHMKSMEAEMAQIRAIKDPAERKAAMKKHMEQMMGMMQGMQGVEHGKMMAGSVSQDVAYLNDRVDLLEAMVNQMVQSRAASYGIYPDGLSAALSDEEYKGN